MVNTINQTEQTSLRQDRETVQEEIEETNRFLERSKAGEKIIILKLTEAKLNRIYTLQAEIVNKYRQKLGIDKVGEELIGTLQTAINPLYQLKLRLEMELEIDPEKKASLSKQILELTDKIRKEHGLD